MKICPFCREEIREDAVKCRYCGSSLLRRPHGGASHEGAAAPSLGTSGCRAPGRDRRARSPDTAFPFSSLTKPKLALCVAGTDCGLGGRVHVALMQGVVLSEN
jgi:hypothetical protein